MSWSLELKCQKIKRLKDIYIKMYIRAYSLIINKINRSLYIIWLLEEIINNSNKYCKSEYTVFIGIICYLFQ